MAPEKKTNSKQKPNTAVRDWTIRGVVFGALAILLVLALLDFQAKQAAASTADAWRAAMKAKTVDADFTKSEFGKIVVHGRPTIVSGRAGTNQFSARSIDTYTWAGVFRRYEVKVYIGLGSDPTIEAITGPGAELAQ
jgi:hypothetical protein